MATTQASSTIKFDFSRQAVKTYRKEHSMNYLIKIYLIFISFSEQLNCKKGQTLIEYVLILVLIAIAIMVAMTFFAGVTGNMYNKVGSTI